MANANMVQGSSEWHRFRSGGIGASDVAVVLGISPFKTRFQLWAEKAGLAKPAPFHPRAISAMERGKLLEDEIRAWYEGKTGRKSPPSVGVNPDCAQMLASFDGLTDDGRVVEIKAPGKKDHGDAKKGKISAKYMAQVQAQLAVAGREVADYVSHDGSRDLSTGRLSDAGGVIIEVRADKEFQARIVAAIQEFWALVESKQAPDVDAKDMDDLIQRAQALQFDLAQTVNLMAVVSESLLRVS